MGGMSSMLSSQQPVTDMSRAGEEEEEEEKWSPPSSPNKPATGETLILSNSAARNINLVFGGCHWIRTILICRF